MHTPTVLTATFLALAPLAVATPSTCLLDAANQYQPQYHSPAAAMQAACAAPDLSVRVKEMCGNDAEAAMVVLKQLCGGKNSTTVSSSSSSSAAAYAYTSHSVYATGMPSYHGSYPAGTAGTAASTMAPMYPIASGSGSSSGGYANGAGNGTAPIATGAPKPPGSVTGEAGVPEATGGAVRMGFGLAGVVVGFVVAAL